jgi:hypothetical protein
LVNTFDQTFSGVFSLPKRPVCIWKNLSDGKVMEARLTTVTGNADVTCETPEFTDISSANEYMLTITSQG